MDRTLLSYKDKDRIKEKTGIISIFTNETKTDVKTEIEVHSGLIILLIITFKKKKKKKIKNFHNVGIISMMGK